MKPRIYHKLIRKIEKTINKNNQIISEFLPKQVIIINFTLKGCKFEITTPTEKYRIEEYGDEEEFTHQILDEIKPRDVVYDIGACIGFITVHACKKGAYVIAFEPDASLRSRLLTNLQLNVLNNYKIVEWSVSDQQGFTTLYTDGVNGWSPSFLEIGKSGAVNVPTDTIDEALDRGELPWPDIVKIDIEGAEILALRGMQRTLNSQNAPRAIFIEIHPDYLSMMNSSTLEVQDFLSSLDYSIVYCKPRNLQLHCIYKKKL